MKYEFILKIKEKPYDIFTTKYRVVCDEKRYDQVKKTYSELNNKDWFDKLLLINKLDDNNEFLEIVQ